MATENLLTDGQPTNDPAPEQTATGDAPAEQQQQAPADGVAPDEGAAADDKGKSDEGADEAPEGAPEAYEDFAAPDGVTLDEAALTEFKGIAKELNLSQTDAQKVADLGPKMMQTWQAKQTEAITATVAKWADDTRADKEIGGEKLNENLATAKKALDTFGTPALKTLLNESGLGNHPEIIRLLHKAGKTISEDGYVGGKRETDGTTDATTLYPNSKMNP